MFKGFIVFCGLVLLAGTVAPASGGAQRPKADTKPEPVVRATAPSSAQRAERLSSPDVQVVKQQSAAFASPAVVKPDAMAKAKPQPANPMP